MCVNVENFCVLFHPTLVLVKEKLELNQVLRTLCHMTRDTEDLQRHSVSQAQQVLLRRLNSAKLIPIFSKERTTKL